MQKNSPSMRLATSLLIVSVFLVSACSSVTIQKVKPVSSKAREEICVISNPKVVHKEFLKTYLQALKSKGFTVQTLPENATVTDCPVTAKYIAYWGWDLALYLSYAKLEIFENGRKAGEAVYRLDKPGLTNKFINTNAKIHELVSKLFPG